MFQVAIPRLRCPVCHKTSSVPPGFLGPRSPYPYSVRQAAVVAYLAGKRGYRPVAAAFRLPSWQLLWQWVNRLALSAKERLAQLTGLLLWYPPPDGGAPAPGLSDSFARDVQAYRAKARSSAKREGLAAIGAVLAQADRFWRAGTALGLPWGEPDPAGLLGFLDVCEKALG